MPEEKRVFLGNNLTPGDIAMIRDIVDVSANQVVCEKLLAIGIDTSKPLDVQDDMRFLRMRRKWSEGGAWHAITVLISLAVVGIGAWVWTGFKIVLK